MKRIVALVGWVVVVMATGCHSKEHHEEAEETFLVTTALKTDTLLYKEYVARVQSVQHIELRALEKGYLQNIYVDEGQHVKKGQLMFQIMPMIYEAEMKKAQAEVNFAEIEYQNTKNLADSNIVSKNELALAKARLDKAKAELALAQAHLGFTEIRAPFDGIMDRFYARLGSLLDEGELLTTLSDNSKVWVYFNVPEAEYLQHAIETKSNTPLQVELQLANGARFNQKGKVETIEADFNVETGNIAYRATFANPAGLLRHGETGNILMPVTLRNALIIPQKATFEILDKKYVFVVGADGLVQTRPITIAQEMPHLYVIAGGLSLNDKILLEGLRKVKNNEKIKYKVIAPETVLHDFDQLHAE